MTVKNCYLQVLARLKNPEGHTYIFCWNTKVHKYIVKREFGADVATEDYAGGRENRRVMRDYDDLASFYRWALNKGWKVLVHLRPDPNA